MDTTLLFITLGGIILIGFAAEWVFKTTRIPDVLILILTGSIVKTLFHIPTQDLPRLAAGFTSFALLYILFHGGLNLRFKDLIKTFTPSLTLTTLSFLITSLLGMLLTLPLTHDATLSLLAGFLLGGTSSAIIIPLTQNLPLQERVKTMLTLESALSDVYSIILSLAMISLLTTGSFALENITQGILTSFAVAILLGMITGFAWLALLQKHPVLAESGMLTIAIMLLLAGIVQSKFVNASSAIAVLTFGIILGNARTAVSLFKKKSLPKSIFTKMDVYDELGFLIKTFFFTYLGMLITTPSLTELAYAVILTLSFYTARPFIIRLTQPKAKREERVILSILIPKGLAAAVLLSIAVQQGVIPPAHPLVNIILWTILLSIILTSMLIILTERFLTPEEKPKKRKRERVNAW